jgi:serine/threonine protein kinase
MAEAPLEDEVDVAPPPGDAAPEQEQEQEAEPEPVVGAVADLEPDGEMEELLPEENPTMSAGLLLDSDAPEEVDDAPPVTLRQRYDIFPSKALPELDSPSAKAFEVIDSQNPGVKIFALICTPDLPVRAMELDEITNSEVPGCMHLIDHGTVYWPSLEQKALALIYQKPLGGRLTDVFAGETSDYLRVDYIRLSLDTILLAVSNLNFRNLTHRAIRHDNLFFTTEKRDEMVLGDFVSAPAGFDQPVAYETIERSMADDGGRGTGEVSDDMYALGVTLAFLCQKGLPFLGKSKEALIISKIVDTSFQALVGSNLYTATMLDLIRGLLNDDPDERWGLDEVELWASGRRVPPTQSSGQKKSQRPLMFGDFGHVSPRTLAYSMARRPESAIKMIRDGTIEQWVSMGLTNKDMAAAIAARLEATGDPDEKNPDKEHMLLTRILMIMDPIAPIRYKGVSYMPDAFGTALAIERLRGSNVRILAESIIKNVPQAWFKASAVSQESVFIENDAYIKIKGYLQKAGPGFGVERCLYELNDGLTCQSPLVKNEYVLKIEDMLPALNSAEKRVDTKTPPIDRHIAAFIAARIGGSIESMLNGLNDPDDALKVMAILKLLAELQVRFGPESLLGLARWIGGQVGPVIKLYHSRITRKAIESAVPDLVRSGQLPALIELLDDPEARLIDQQGYAMAVAQFELAEDEIQKIHEDMGPVSTKTDRTAKQVAAVTSITIMTFVIALLIISG